MNSHPTRREALALAAAGLLTACRPDGRAAAASAGKEPLMNTSTAPIPVAFVGHGSPTLALDPVKGAELTAWAQRWPALRGVVVLSAHWEDAPVQIGATRTLPLIYDFYGFPKALYDVQYAAPGAPWLADRVAGLLQGQPVQRAPERGLDHGAWVPLKWFLPKADVPVLAVSLPSQDPQALFALGRKLAPLRSEGVLILGSGNVTHNLRQVSFRGDPPPPAWATEFDAWVSEVVQGGQMDALLQWQTQAPAARMNHPTVEHFTPLLVAAGAAWGDGGRPKVTWPVQGWEYGSLSRRGVQFG